MKETWRKLREYASRVREALSELNRDPYMVLVDCTFIRHSLSGEEDLSESSKSRVERSLRDLEGQATFDWDRNGYGKLS
ncbi:MAG: hypothetical protein AABX10_03180 [Nanoarchaeota archaeon]